VIYLEKALELVFSFAFRHFKESFKNSFTNLQFASLKLTLSERFSSLITSFDLVDQIVLAREQSRITRERFTFASSSLTFASLTFIFSDISTENSDVTTISTKSLNMFEYLTQGFAGSFEQTSFFTNQESFETTSDSMFFVAQRFEIADIVAAVVRSIQMQQPTSSSTTDVQDLGQNSFFNEFIKK
jgi:hypothetical protein